MSTKNSVRVGVGPFRKALVLESPDPSLDDHLRACGIEPFRPRVTPNEDELVRLLEQEPWELIFKRSRVPITPRVLDAAPHLFGVMLCCIGDDSVDKVATAQRGVLVCNDPISNARSVVEMVFGELICLSRRIFQAADETNRNVFVKSQDARYELLGKKLGILGLGNIGKQVAQLAEALGMHVVFYDNRDVAREVGETMGWTLVPTITDLFRASDFVTCHVSAFDYNGRSNDGLLTWEHFAAFSEKDHDSPRVFLNAARGNIHSAEDLLRAVDEGHITQAMVDVFPLEPNDRHEAWHNPYAGHPRIFGTPHIGASTLEAQPRIARRVASTTALLSRKGTLRDCVYKPKNVIGLEDGDGASHLITVVHSTKRGTKKAVDDAIYNAGASNVISVHRDFLEYGIAYEVIAVDKLLNEDQIHHFVQDAIKLTGDPDAIRAIRQIELGG